METIKLQVKAGYLGNASHGNHHILSDAAAARDILNNSLDGGLDSKKFLLELFKIGRYRVLTEKTGCGYKSAFHIDKDRIPSTAK